MSDPFDRFGQYGIRTAPNGDITVMPPAALGVAQAHVPGDLRKAEMVAQVVINVPVSKIERFLQDVQAMLTDEEWRGPAEGLVP